MANASMADKAKNKVESLIDEAEIATSASASDVQDRKSVV